VHQRWDAIVLDGERKALGMPGFASALTPEDSHAVHAYVVSRARVLEETSVLPSAEIATTPP
jgi:mono/diheme cytochrome c family protein